MKKTLSLILAAVMAFSLVGCGFSSESSTTTSFSTSTTDAEGNTTTQTVTNEIGISADQDGIHTKNETTHDVTTSVAGSMAESFPPKEEWYDAFSEGAEGENEDGDVFYLAFDDPEDVSYAMLLIVFADGNIMVRNGEVLEDEEYGGVMIYDKDVDSSIPFEFLDADEEGSFVVHFLANDTAVTLSYVGQDTIISDIYNILANAVPNSQDADEAAEMEDAG